LIATPKVVFFGGVGSEYVRMERQNLKLVFYIIIQGVPKVLAGVWEVI
jgi:hypothetical protein